MSEARVDKITMTYFKKGKCEVCGGSAERTKSFYGAEGDMAQMEAEAAVWDKEPIRHKRCEGYIAEHR